MKFENVDNVIVFLGLIFVDLKFEFYASLLRDIIYSLYLSKSFSLFA